MQNLKYSKGIGFYVCSFCFYLNVTANIKGIRKQHLKVIIDGGKKDPKSYSKNMRYFKR